MGITILQILLSFKAILCLYRGLFSVKILWLSGYRLYKTKPLNIKKVPKGKAHILFLVTLGTWPQLSIFHWPALPLACSTQMGKNRRIYRDENYIILFTVGHVFRDNKETGLTTQCGWMFSLVNRPLTFTCILQEIPLSGTKGNIANIQAPCENKKKYHMKIYPKSWHRVWMITKAI